MMLKDYSYFSVGNYFTKETLEELKQQLEKGQKISVGVDCIGHTRNNMVQEEFRQALEEYYKDRIQVELNDGWCSYSYTYQLVAKDEA